MSLSGTFISVNQKWPYQVEDFKIPSKDDFTPFFWLVFSFAFGIIFSPFSYGFLFLIISFIPFEMYMAYRNYKTIGPEYIFWRGAYIFATVVGFLLGRIMIVDDDLPFRSRYEDNKNKKYFYKKSSRNGVRCYRN